MVSQPETQETPVTPNEFWKNAEFAPLVNHQDLRRITEHDPWQYEVAGRLKNFLYRMESKKVVNFRVSGIVLHSASVLCRAKSQTIIEQGNQIQDALEEGQLDAGDDAIMDMDDGLDASIGQVDGVDGETSSEPGQGRAGRITVRDIANGSIEIDKAVDILASGRDAMNRIAIKDRLDRFNVPRRIVARPVTVADLSVALNDALAGKFKRKTTREQVKEVRLPDSITNQYNNEFKIENLVDILNGKVHDLFADIHEPISFCKLFDGDILDTKCHVIIVRAFLAVLYMINRKLIEVWQNSTGEILIVPRGMGREFFETT